MNNTITEHMKNKFLLKMKEWYDTYGGTIPITEYEFSLATKWYVDNLPLLEKISSANKDYQIDVVKHLESEGLVTLKSLKFQLTEKGVEKIKHLIKPSKGDTPSSKAANWQNNISVYILVSVIIIIIGGFILHKITSQ